VQGILGGMSAAIDATLGARRVQPGGYVRTIVVRAGQLNREGMRETLKATLAAITSPLPLVILCYVLGNDVRVDADGALAGEPITIRHDCAFAAICADADARGQEAQLEGTPDRPGLIRMISDVREVLGGMQFVARDEEAGADFDLNESPLLPAGVEPIDKVPNVSAYALHFLTDFFLSTADRTAEPVQVDIINFGIDLLNNPSGPGGMPGVHPGGHQS
jgi:hypothetical protein